LSFICPQLSDNVFLFLVQYLFAQFCDFICLSLRPSLSLSLPVSCVLQLKRRKDGNPFMDDDTLEQQLTQEWKDEDITELMEKEEKVRCL
jgi:hypothetical protein